MNTVSVDEYYWWLITIVMVLWLIAVIIKEVLYYEND